MEKNARIYIAGHNGMVGSAIKRNLESKGFNNIVYRSLEELNLLDEKQVAGFFEAEKPEYVVLAAAKVGGIVANNTYRAQFIYENLMIQNHVIHQSYLHGVKKLIVFRFILYLSAFSRTTHKRRSAVDRITRTNQRTLRHCQNCRY